jgi:hypothetical protein
MKKSFLLVLVILLVVVNMVFIINQNKINAKIKRTSELAIQIHAKDSLIISNFKKLIDYNYYRDYLALNINLKKNIQDDKVILYFSENDCSSCIYDIYKYLENLASMIGDNKFIIVGNFKNEKLLKQYLELAPYFINDVIILQDTCYIQKIKSPAVFVLTNKYEVKLLYVPDLYPGYKEQYFNNILVKYFKKNR